MRWALAFAGALAASSATAQDVDCDNPIAQVEMTYCAGKDYEAADAQLNAAYKLALAQADRIDDSELGFDVSTRTLLRDAQRAWIPFRDAACSAEARLAFGGTMQNQIFLMCLTRLTEARTQDLLFFGETN